MKKIFLLSLFFSTILFAATNETLYHECSSPCRTEMRKCRDEGNDSLRCLDKRNECVKKCRDLYMDSKGAFKKN